MHTAKGRRHKFRVSNIYMRIVCLGAKSPSRLIPVQPSRPTLSHGTGSMLMQTAICIISKWVKHASEHPRSITFSASAIERRYLHVLFHNGARTKAQCLLYILMPPESRRHLETLLILCKFDSKLPDCAHHLDNYDYK